MDVVHPTSFIAFIPHGGYGQRTKLYISLILGSPFAVMKNLNEQVQ